MPVIVRDAYITICISDDEDLHCVPTMDVHGPNHAPGGSLVSDVYPCETHITEESLDGLVAVIPRPSLIRKFDEESSDSFTLDSDPPLDDSPQTPHTLLHRGTSYLGRDDA